MIRVWILGAVMCALAMSVAGVIRADGPPADQTASLFASATRALAEGRAGDAIDALEALADRGLVDAVASYDRGLAYAMRVRIGAEVSGDLGRAAEGFEEARDLSTDPRLRDDAAHALVVVRSEVARRRLHAGQPVEVDPGRSLSRALARFFSEETWSLACVALALLLTAGLGARWLGRSKRLRLGGGVTAGVAVPLLVMAAAMTLAVRHDRWSLREAVVVSSSARPTDEHGITRPGAVPLPEGARVEILASEAGSTRVRFGATDAWVPSSVLREIARRD